MSKEDEIPYMAALSPPTNSGDDKGSPDNWKEALGCLFASRIAIIHAEGKVAAALGAKKATYAALALFGILFAWILILSGAIGGISAATSWAWYQVAFVAAGLHLVIGIFAVVRLNEKSASPFPVTRAEFEKDREWLNQLNKQPK